MKTKRDDSFHAGVSLIGNPHRHKTFLGSDEVMVHDMDRETAWISLKGGLPMLMTVRLRDLRIENV